MRSAPENGGKYLLLATTAADGETKLSAIRARSEMVRLAIYAGRHLHDNGKARVAPRARIAALQRNSIGMPVATGTFRPSLHLRGRSNFIGVEMPQNALPQSEPDEAQLIERARQNDCTAIRLIIKQGASRNRATRDYGLR
jgi:hypothetical protein